MRKRWLSINGICKMDIHMWKNKMDPYLVQLKIYQKCKQRPQTAKLLEEYIGESFIILVKRWFVGYDTKSTPNKIHSVKTPNLKALHSKGNNRYNKKAAYGMGH